jgi:hypothetical protein
VRKDFPPALGYGIVAIAAGAFLALSGWRRMTMWGFIVILAAVALDALTNMLAGTVAVCYRCGQPLHGRPVESSLREFDASIAEKYRPAGDDQTDGQ